MADPSTLATNQADRRMLSRIGLVTLLRALGLMVLLNALIFYPYAEDTWPSRLLVVYLKVVAVASARVIALWDHTVMVQGTQIGGRFPLTIVLDCAGLDIQALCAAAIAVFPTSLGRRLRGLCWVTAALFAVNILRIAALQLVGVRAPDYFHVMHEEVFVVLLVVSALGFFLLWASDRKLGLGAADRKLAAEAPP